jgi:putative aminopeptidase FrvX
MEMQNQQQENKSLFPPQFALLYDLLGIDSPTGDERVMIDFLTDLIRRRRPDAELVSQGSSLIVKCGDGTNTAVIAHVDTTGFTLGYCGKLIPIGSPAVEPGDTIKAIGADDREFGVDIANDACMLRGTSSLEPGDRLVYSASPGFDGTSVISPYLDNRAGIWAALELVWSCKNVVVAFSSGEEVSGHGARVCARYLYETLGIGQVLISDITWDTDDIHIGSGPAMSLRDARIPNRLFVDKLIKIARATDIPFQVEIESDGGSDGGHIERGCYPIDWMFVGAPEADPHSSHETLNLNDLANMAKLLETLVNGLS